ncbi:MAG: M16 family metallopeptidase, partial [Flavobacteriales bacterium]
PAPAPAPSVRVGEHKRFDLPNGLRVIVVENHKLPKVDVQLRFDHAPLAQGDKAGFVDLFGELLEAGTAKRTKAQIDEQVDRLGAQLTTSPEGLYASVLKKHLGAMMDLVAEIATQPAFPEEELEKARKRMISSVQQRKDDPQAIAETVGRAMAFGKSHPYGEVVTEKSLQKASRENLVAYHAKFFRPEKGFLVFVGAITEKEAKSIAKERFGKWKPAPKYSVVQDDGTEVIPGIGAARFLTGPAVPKGPRRVVLVDRPGAPQSVVRVCYPLNLHPKDLRALPAQVMNTILGGGVFNARLMQNLREDKGWTYGCYSTLEADRFNGQFFAQANVRTEVTDSAASEIIRELERMRQGRVTDEELGLAKRYMAGSFGRSLEDPRTVGRFALNTYLYELPADHYATYLKRLEAVSAADVQAAAEAFLHPDNAVILVVGDKRKLLPRLEAISWSSNPRVLEVDHNAELFREEFERVPGLGASDVIERHLAAIGGREAIARIKDMRMDLTADMMGVPVEMTQWYGQDGLYRSVAKAGDAILQEEAFDGERAVRRGMRGEEELEDRDLAEIRINGLPVPELRYQQLAERLVVAGRIAVEGKPAIKLAVILPEGGSIGEYYDEATGLKVRRVEQKSVDGRVLTITTDYLDYQPAGGVKFPRTIVQSGAPGGELTMKVRSIEINPGLKPAFFATNLPERKVEPYVEPAEENPLQGNPGDE